jgi:hypothetical protein
MFLILNGGEFCDTWWEDREPIVLTNLVLLSCDIPVYVASALGGSVPVMDSTINNVRAGSLFG